MVRLRRRCCRSGFGYNNRTAKSVCVWRQAVSLVGWLEQPAVAAAGGAAEFEQRIEDREADRQAGVLTALLGTVHATRQLQLTLAIARATIGDHIVM